MAYTRPCNKCGQRISMREMPHVQWVAFDVSTEDIHVCGTTHEPDPNIERLAKKNKSKRKEEDEGVSLGYEDDEELNEETKTFDNASGINRCINKAIKEKKRIDITYQSYGGQVTSRQISPIKKFKYKNVNHLQAYCHMRSAERNFKIASISETNLTNKKIFKSKKIGKPKLEEYIKGRTVKKSSPIDTVYDQTSRDYSTNNISEKTDGMTTWGFIIMIAIIGGLISFIFG